MEEKYRFADIRVAEPPAPTDESRVRRELADHLRVIIDKLIRTDVPMERLQEYQTTLAGLAADVSQWPRRPLVPMMQRLVQGEGSRQDLLDVMDNEIMTGLGTPLSPPLTLRLEDNLVCGNATLGLPWQGPPGRVHGGVIGLIMDILLAKTQDMLHGVGMTGTLNIRYRAATPLKQELTMQAGIERIEGRKLFSRGWILADGKVTAEADGIWICASGNYSWKSGFGPMQKEAP